MKKLLLVLAGLAISVSALANLTKYKDWDKGPEAYFLTPAERAEWKGVQTDEDAEKFIALYYAKRGGDAFKQEISRRIAAADQQFKMQRYKRGADSVRGHLLIVLGTPSTVATVSGEAFYYISQRSEQPVSFMPQKIIEQRVVAVYFDKNRRVERLADYGLKDGKVFDYVSRTTPTSGQELSYLNYLFNIIKNQ